MGKKKGSNSTKQARGHDQAQDAVGQEASRLPDPNTSRSAQKQRARAESEESRFSKLNAVALENLNLIATYTNLQRPVSPSVKSLRPSQVGSPEGTSTADDAPAFKLPKKPRWHHDLTARAVQSNEDSVFQDWLSATDSTMHDRFPLVQGHLSQPVDTKHLPRITSPSQCLLPSLFERNVQVYRQLWRVIERSNLLLVLLDSRCPLLHLPPSLETYLKRFASMRTILVLTKKDIVGEQVAGEWKAYLQDRYGWPVVVTESYRRQARQEGQGRRSRFIPFLSQDSRKALFSAIKDAHTRLTTPPQRVREDPVKLREWNPPCTPTINWAEVENLHDSVTQGGEGEGEHGDGDGDAATSASASTCESPPFTIGLIGQPNVGKSSLLNALIGSKVVHASRTPGKTKHFQTHHLSRSPSSSNPHGGAVLLCDSPGLVFPSGAGQELQVLGAILPISQVQAITTVVRFIADHMPLEKVLDLDLPPDEFGDGNSDDSERWTATKILEALCRRHGYKTAKAGRWDVNRAGNALVRSVAEGRIQWAFRPPMEGESKDKDDTGIWLGHHTTESVSMEDEDADEDDEEQQEETEQPSHDSATTTRRQAANENGKSVRFDVPSDEEHEQSEEDDVEEEEDDDAHAGGPVSMFNALAVEGGESESEDTGASGSEEEP